MLFIHSRPRAKDVHYKRGFLHMARCFPPPSLHSLHIRHSEDFHAAAACNPRHPCLAHTLWAILPEAVFQKIESTRWKVMTWRNKRFQSEGVPAEVWKRCVTWYLSWFFGLSSVYVQDFQRFTVFHVIFVNFSDKLFGYSKINHLKTHCNIIKTHTMRHRPHISC